jgi:sortase (surface protein transpeptidase)
VRDAVTGVIALVVLAASTSLLAVRADDSNETIALPDAPAGPSVVSPAPDIAASPSPPKDATSTACPQMDNPGGLAWEPRADAGPRPTAGSVVLPALGVDAPIVRVGVNTSGTMEVPKNARDVAWLDQGGIPGKTNNVVLAGHISYSRVAGSFMRIGSLRPGDEVKMDMNGKHYTYRVTFVCLFGRETDRASQIMGYTETPSLTLISCGGGWDAGARTHTGRYAVRAELVDGPGSETGDRTEARGADATAEPDEGSLLDLGP